MKRTLFILLSMIVMISSLEAQPGRQRKQDRIHAVKVSYITDRLKLTPAEAERFWPVYNQYEEETMRLRRDFIQRHRRSGDSEAEATSRQYIEEHIELQERVLELKKKYKDRFLKVISAAQLAELYKAEAEFRRMLIERLRERRKK